MRKFKHGINLLRFATGAERPITGPVKLIWDVTYRCNLRCQHCHLWQTTEHNDLDTEEAKAFLQDVARLGTLQISFSGGEPFLRKDMYDLIAYSRDLGMATSVNTNGMRLALPEYARRACESGLGMAFISLDGPDAETHNALRGNHKAFDSAVRAIDNLVAMRKGRTPSVFINTTVTSDNVDRMEEILELARAHGADGMTMSVLHDIGKYSPEVGMDSDGLTEKLRALAAKSDGLIPHGREYLENFETYRMNPDSLYRYRCAAAYSIAVVHADGTVYPCPVPFASMGNIREKPFREIWFSPEADQMRRRIKANRHPVCWFDCIAPLNVLLDHVRRLDIRNLLHRETRNHISRKLAR
ncbi:MAG: radical SAM protein [Armatimonadota bacterium]